MLTGQFQNVLQQLLRTHKRRFCAAGHSPACCFGKVGWRWDSWFFWLEDTVAYDRFFRSRMRVYGQRQNLAAQIMVKGIHEGLEGLKEIRILGKSPHFHRPLGWVRRGLQPINDVSCWFKRHHATCWRQCWFSLSCAWSWFDALSFRTCCRGFAGHPWSVWSRCDPLAPNCNQLAATLTNLRFNRDAVSRLYADVQQLSAQGSIVQLQSNAATSQFLKLQLKDVGYRYPNTRQDALLDLDLEIRAGESIGLIGPSGSGKTTFG